MILNIGFIYVRVMIYGNVWFVMDVLYNFVIVNIIYNFKNIECLFERSYKF